VRIPAAADE